MELVLWNFGIHEGGKGAVLNEIAREVFPGAPVIKNGYMYVNEAPGLGVDINEKEAAKYPISNQAGNWTLRRRDGTIISP